MFTKAMYDKYVKYSEHAARGTDLGHATKLLSVFDEYKELMKGYLACVNAIPFLPGDPAIVRATGEVVLINTLGMSFNKESTQLEILTCAATKKCGTKAQMKLADLAPYGEAGRVLFSAKQEGG